MAHKDASVSWVDGNFGSKVTMKYPCVILKEPGARADIISIAVADHHQHQDSGAKVIHQAPYTYSTIVAKSIGKGTGRTSYRGLVTIAPRAVGVRSRVQCDALLLSPAAQSDTYPVMSVKESQVTLEHEASVTRISDDQLFYLMARGISEAMARSLIVTGFIEPFVQLLPMEYAVEINRLLLDEMEGSIG